jgi:hypothetical protein
MIIVAQSAGAKRAMMIALVLELCGGVCAFSAIAFLGLASVSKLRPDLEEERDADLEMLLLTEDRWCGRSFHIRDAAASTPRAAATVA